MASLKYATFVLFVAAAYAQHPTKAFEVVGSYSGIGSLASTTVAPGTSPGSERFYASYIYGAGSLDVLSIDPNTGKTEVFHSPIAGEAVARSFAVGPNGNVFMGTQPTGHFLKLDKMQHKLIDLGRPSASEVYIWDVAFGSDDRLYGVTFPDCKLVRYDPNTGHVEDLGRLDPIEEYARFIVGSSDGFLYIGIGSSKANIAAYNIRTGEHREILPPDAQVPAIAKIFRGQDGNIYGAVGIRQFRLNQWTATELEPGHTVPAASTNTLHDGRTLALTDNQASLSLTVTDPKTSRKVEEQISYGGQPLQLLRLCFGPDDVLYATSSLPLDLLKVDTRTHHLTDLGNLGPGEVYSLFSHGQTLLMAAYSGLTTLMSYKPGLPFHPAAKSGNPLLIPFRGDSPAWRPMAMVDGPDGNAYIGSVAAYGLLNAPLIQWNTENESIQQFNDIVPDQSTISLTTWHNLVIGGTSIYGGEGSRATQKDARLFIWNPTTQAKEFDIAPVPSAPRITDLIAAPNGRIYGVAGDIYGTAGAMLFVFDPETRKIISRQKLPFVKPIYNSVALGNDGRIWGLAEQGIFTIDTKTNLIALMAPSPVKITGGFAMRNGKIYFISNSTIYSYIM